MNLFKYIISAILAAVILIGGVVTGEKFVQPASSASTQSFGSFTPVGGQTYTLSGSGITSTQNTVPLTSFTTPDGRALVMSDFGSVGYAVIDPNSPSKIEDITFTGISQSPNGTATLTGVSRGMDFISPYLASSSLAYSHAGGAYLILSNTAGFYGQQFFFLNNNGTSSATLVFGSTTPPMYDADPVWLNFTPQILADVSYVNSVVAAGAANASTLVKGIIQIATSVQVAAGTATGSTGALLVPPNSLYNATQSATTIIPVTNTSGKLAQAFLDLTQLFPFSGGILSSASSTYTATTSISASNVLTNAVIFNKIPYAFPSSQGAANSVLTNGGTGILSWSAVPTPIKYSVVSATGPSSSSFATSSVLNIPAGALTASSTWSATINGTCTTSTGDCVYYLRDNGGTTLATCDFGSNTVSNFPVFLTFTGGNQNSLSAQSTLVSGWMNVVGNTSNLLKVCQTVGTATFNTAGSLNLVLVVQGGGGTISINSYSITVTP